MLALGIASRHQGQLLAVRERKTVGWRKILLAGRFWCVLVFRSQIDSVIRYIQNQPRHHARHTFRREYIELLRKFEVDYDEKYIFKTV